MIFMQRILLRFTYFVVTKKQAAVLRLRYELLCLQKLYTGQLVIQGVGLICDWPGAVT